MSTVGGPRLSTIPTFQNTYSMDFDGVDDYLDLGTESTVASGSQFTLSFWIKGGPTGTGSSQRFLFSTDGSSKQNYSWHAHGSDFIWRNINSIPKFLSIGVLDNSWHHILVIFNPTGAAQTIRCFTDGANEVNVSTDWRYAPPHSYYDGPIRYIGGSPPRLYSGGPFNGNIDEFAVWDDDQSANVSTIYNGGAPNDLTDLSPDYWLRNGDNGSYKSPQWLLPSNENKDKVSNYSFELDGIDDYISTGLDLSFATVPNFSISYWIKTDATLTNFASYFAVGVNVAYGGGAYNYSAGRLYKSQSLGLLVYAQGSGSSNGSTVLDDGNWHHIIQTYSDNGNNTSRVRIYVDGNTTPEVDLASTLSYAPLTSNLFIGARNASSDRAFPGNVDEVSVWDSVLSTEEITALYNSGTPTTLPSGAVAHYKMGEQANFTSNWLVDNSALSNYSKRSFAFDGIGDKIELGNPTDLQITGAFSFSCWVNTTSTNYEGIYFKGNSVALSDIYIRRQNNGTVRFFINNVSKNVTSNTTVNDGNWHHIMCVYVPSTSMTIYIDGSQDAKNTNTIPVSINNNYGNISIGEGGGQFFNGKIDEVSIFNTVVDIADVWDGSGEPIDVSAVSGIVGNYRMGEDASFNGTDWTIPDQAGGNNGTSDGMMVDALVGEAPNYTGGGISEGMTIDERVGNAPNSENNALSYNMEREDRVEDTP